MRLPLVSNIVPGGMNALYQQMLNNQMLAAKAKYAQPTAFGQAQQQLGQGAVSQAQGQYAPAFFAGQAAEQAGIGQQELAKGGVSVPLALATLQQQQQAALQAGLTTQQVAALTRLYPQMTVQDLIKLTASARTATAQAQQAPAQYKANVINTLTPTLSTVLSHPAPAATILPTVNNLLGAIKNSASKLSGGAGAIFTGGGGNENVPYAVGTRHTFLINGKQVPAVFDGRGWKPI